MKYLYIISFLFFALVACEEEKPELFSPDRYIRLQQSGRELLQEKLHVRFRERWRDR